MSLDTRDPLLSPLQEIEHTVQLRANALALDVDSTDGEAHLSTLIDEAVTEWSEDYSRGHRRYDLPDPDGVAARAFRNLARYGPLTELLTDDDVWEIMVNAPDEIFVKRHSGGNRFHHEVFHDDDHVIRTLTKLLDDSSTSHRKLDPVEGLQDAQLDDGARLHIVHGDLARGGHLMVNIRKFTGVAITRLDELVDGGSMSTAAARFLAAAVRARLSIVFAGAPGAGKTTLLSCCAAELDPSLRVVIAEEVFEADCEVANVASMQTRPARTDRPGIDLRRLVAGFLRMAPDVAIVGEVRDRETALAALTAAETGHSVFATLHAGGCFGTVDRFLSLTGGGEYEAMRLAGAFLCGIHVSSRTVTEGGESFIERTYEVFRSNDAARTHIRERAAHRLWQARLGTSEKDWKLTIRT